MKCRLVTLLVLISSPLGFGQRLTEEGASSSTFATGLNGPSSIAVDAQGHIFVGSYYDRYGSGWTDIYRVLPDGTVSIFSDPVYDPDVLCLDSNGDVYVGSYGGRITKIDAETEVQSNWAWTGLLGNIDGMAFDDQGDMIVSAISHERLYKVDGTTQSVNLFADLTPLGHSGYGSVAIDPVDGSIFVTTPHDGVLVRLNSSGQVTDANFATGFAHMGQLSIDGPYLYAVDNARGEVRRIDRATKQSTTIVVDIEDLASGFTAVGNGIFFGTSMPNSIANGSVYRIAPFEVSVTPQPEVGSPSTLTVSSPADALLPVLLFFSAGNSGVPLRDGRELAIDLATFYGPAKLSLDAQGLIDVPFDVPADPMLGGVTLYLAAISFDMQRGVIQGVSEGSDFTILP